MNLTSLTVSDFKRITQLLERKESHQAEISDIDRELEGFSPGQPAARSPREAAKPGRVARRGKGGRMKRGQLKETIISLLKAAGREGLSVKELATKMKVNPANIHVWFGSTGKKVSEIKKDKGRRVWVG